MPTNASPQFAELQEAFRLYSNEHFCPGTPLAAVAIECAELLRELAFLDRSIVEAFGRASQDHMAEMQSLIDMAIEKDPDSDFARAVRQHPHLVQSAVGYTQPGFGSANGTSSDVLLRLQTDTASFYQKAHRMLHLMQDLPALETVRCDEIMIVRNQLIEHAGTGSSNRTDWSFGFATGRGPQVRPLVVGGAPPSHVDAGYFPNRDALLTALQSIKTAATA